MALAFIPAPTDFTGRWVLERTENLEDFMKHSLGQYAPLIEAYNSSIISDWL